MKYSHISVKLFSSFIVLALFTTSGFGQNNKPSQSYGYIHFKFNVDTAYVRFGMRKPVIRKIANDDTVKVKNGFYHLYISYPTNEDTYVTRNVLKDSLYTVEHDFDLSRQQIDLKSDNASIRYLAGGDIVILSDYDTDIFLNDSLVSTGFGILDLSASKNEITLKNSAFYPKEFTPEKQDHVIFKEYYFYPTEGSFSALNLIPGISQLKRKEYVKTGIILGTIITAGSFFIKYQSDYSSQLKDYNALRDLYLEADNEREALLAGNKMKEAAKDFDSINLKRNIALWTVLGTMAFDIIEKIYARRKLGHRKERDIKLFIEPKFSKFLSVGAAIKL